MSQNILSTNVLHTFPEARYLVLKESDLYQAGHAGLIPMGHFEVLREIYNAVNDIRSRRGKENLEVLVVEKDWPEYQPTLELLGVRVRKELDAVLHPDLSTLIPTLEVGT